MRADSKTYVEVAKNCSAFAPKNETNTFTNSSSESGVSCTNCRHFTENKYCELDLYDQILVNHDIQ